MKVLYGSQNFGYALEDSDKDYMQFVYPTWDDILKNNVISKEVKNADGNVTKIKDVRLIPKMIEKGNFNDLQFLYSKEVSNADEFMWLFENRDRLVKANIYGSVKSNKGYILSCIKKGTRKDLVRAMCFNMLLDRLLFFKEFKMEIKGLSKYRENERIGIPIEEIYTDLENYEDMAKRFSKDEDILAELDEFILKLLRNNLTESR